MLTCAEFQTDGPESHGVPIVVLDDDVEDVPAGDEPLEGVEGLPRVAPDDVAPHVHVGVGVVVRVAKVLRITEFINSNCK